MRKYAALIAVLSIAIVSVIITGCQVKEVTSAKVYIQQDNWEKAQEQLEQAVALYPTNAEAWYLLGQAHARKNNFEDMNAAFEKSLAAGPNFRQQIVYERDRHYVSYFNNGHKRATGGLLEEALQDFETCAVIDPDRPGTYKNIGYVYVQMGDMTKATEYYEKSLELDPEDMDSMRSLNSLYLQQERFEEVVAMSDRVIALDPTDTETIANKAIAYDFLGEREQAFATYDEALKMDPENADLIFNLGRLYYMAEEYDKAIEQFQKVIEKNPEDIDANLNVGNGYMNIADFMRRKWSDDVEAGKTFTEQEEADYAARVIEFYEKAIPYLEKVVELDPENANAWYNLGVAYVNCNMSEKGQVAFDKHEELTKEPPPR